MRSGRGAGSVVVVGSSAGGIEALSTLLSGLDSKLPAAVVVAQHMDPTRRSHLQEVLQRKTKMPVVSLAGRTTLEPGTVYLAPAHRDIVIAPGKADLEVGGDGKAQPSVDRLLTTAAQAYGDRTIAVILSGNLSDGASGAVEVKQAGGTVVIQDPRTAQYPSMPSALPPTAVDHVCDLEGIARLLGELLVADGTAREPRPEMAGPLAQIIEMVTRRSNVEFGSYKTSTVLRRVERRMATIRAPTVADYARYLGDHPDEVAALAQALIIKVTEFFRDPEAFVFLRTTVLPALIERARPQGRQLRFWSAGCATGEEPYSLAMVVADVLGDEIGSWSVRVFATDLDDGAVAFARRGTYPPAVVTNVPADYRQRFFERDDDTSYRVNRALRQMVIYGQQDLSRAVPFPRIDLVVCRNLLIYFQAELQQDLLDLFAYSLHDTGGYLFLGRAETARPSGAAFELVSKKWKVYRCVDCPPTVRGLGGPRRGAAAAEPGSSPAKPAEGETLAAPRFDDLVLRSMDVGTVVVDRLYRMVTLNAAARTLLGIHDRGGERDFLHSVRGIPYAEIRGAIDAVLRDQKPVRLREVGLGPGDTAEPRYVSLGLAPMAGDGRAAADHIVVTVVDASETVQARRRLEAAEAAQRKLVEELNATNTRLNETNKDLHDANDELQAANEELMLAQEELQATNEEFEATNEELQATNEELETNNEELQATNEELDTTNAELQARTDEMQALTAVLTRQGERLREIVAKSPIPVLVLRGLPPLVETASPPFAAIVGEGAAAGRGLDDVFAMAPSVARGVREALVGDAAWIGEPVAIGGPGAEAPGRMYVFTAVPLHDDGAAAGVAVYADEVPAGAPPAADRKR